MSRSCTQVIGEFAPVKPRVVQLTNNTWVFDKFRSSVVLGVSTVAQLDNWSKHAPTGRVRLLMLFQLNSRLHLHLCDWLWGSSGWWTPTTCSCIANILSPQIPFRELRRRWVIRGVRAKRRTVLSDDEPAGRRVRTVLPVPRLSHPHWTYFNVAGTI